MIDMEFIKRFIRNTLYIHTAQNIVAKDVLEIGCGDGTGTQSEGQLYLASQAKSYVGIDKKPYKNPLFRFIQKDIMKGPVPKKKYDAVIALYVIQYVNADKFFERVAKMVRPGGCAVFSEGLRWNQSEEKGTVERLYKVAEESLSKFFAAVAITGLHQGGVVPKEYGTDGMVAIVSQDSVLVKMRGPTLYEPN